MEVKTILVVAAILGGSLYAWHSSEYIDKVEATFPGWQNDSKIPLVQHSNAEVLNIDDFLVGVIENFRDDMLTGIPELKVPVLDPFQHRKPIKVDVNDSKAVFQLNLTDLQVTGLSGFVLEELLANLQNLSLKFRLRIPCTYVTGNYSMDGKVVKIIPLRGDGPFWVEAKNLTVSAHATMVNADERLQLHEDFDVDLDFGAVQMDFENFMGGGRWTEVLLKILNDMSKDIFHKFLPLLKTELNKSLLKVINKQMSKLPITSFIPGSTANEYVDQILLNVRQMIHDKKLDPLSLPEFYTNFSKEIAYITFHGDARLYDGWLSGISSIQRTDECSLNSSRQTIHVSAHLGLQDLRIYYKGQARFMSWGPKIECGGYVKTVSFFFSIEQRNAKGAVPDLRDFQIEEVSTIWIELSGLGPLTWIMKWMLTGISKMVEDFIVIKVTEFMRGYLQEEFTKLSFPV